MHKLLALVVLLCALVAHATVASTAMYGSCCVDDCKGIAQCVGTVCPACATPAAAAGHAPFHRAVVRSGLRRAARIGWPV